MSDPHSDPRDEQQSPSDDLFENLPDPVAQAPTANITPPVPGSRRAAREAAMNGSPTSADDARPGAAGGGAADSSESPVSDLGALLEHSADEDSDAAKKRRRGCLVALIVVLAVVGGLAAGGAWVWNSYGDKISEALGWGEPKDWESGIASGEVLVTIRSGDTGKPVSASLYEAGVTRTKDVFYDYLVKEDIKITFYPGIYRLQKKMTAEAALEALQDPANKSENSVSVAEGATVASSLPTIAETLGIPLADFEAAVADPSSFGVSAQSLEGWLFPAVYTFDPGVTATQVIQRMVDRTRESLANAGVKDADAQRVLTIASIIQREGRTDDFPKVSRVIQNRLAIDMKLQMDSTAQYGYGELHAGSVSTSEEAQFNDNPWNTYVLEGLPATPISTVSDAAIAAAVRPSDGPWLYFVTVNPESGETVFSETYEQHEAAIEQWARWCDENGNPENGCAS